MVRILGLGAVLALGLMGCEAPFVAVSPEHDRDWAEQRRLCVASPGMGHCDVYLRNAIPPAPYTTDGILVEQRRRCFESRSFADCALAQRMGQDAEAEAAGRLPPTGAAADSRKLQARTTGDEDAAPPQPMAGDASSVPAEAAIPTVPRARRRATSSEAAAPCTPAVLESLDLVEEPARAAILRRCGSRPPGRNAGAQP